MEAPGLVIQNLATILDIFTLDSGKELLIFMTLYHIYHQLLWALNILKMRYITLLSLINFHNLEINFKYVMIQDILIWIKFSLLLYANELYYKKNDNISEFNNFYCNPQSGDYNVFIFMM